MKCKITFIIRELSLSYKESKLSSGAIESKTLSIVITPVSSFVDSRYRLSLLVFLGSYHLTFPLMKLPNFSLRPKTYWYISKNVIYIQTFCFGMCFIVTYVLCMICFSKNDMLRYKSHCGY